MKNSEDKTTTFFFVLSGEHSTLPFSELESILEAEGYEYRVLGKLTQVLRLKTNANSLKPIVFRAAMTRICCMELFNCDANTADILEKMRDASTEDFIKDRESFVVRVHRIRGSAPQVMGMELERKLGEIIFKRAKNVKVSLKSPQKIFLGVLTDNKFLFGLKMAEISPKTFVERRPRNKPFFRPSAMPAKLARCMVNLAQPKAGNLILDPFCGTAGLLIEAGLIGCRVVGMDVQRHVVKGGLRNLLHYNVKPEGMAVADATCLPIAKVDCIVTDPPYGRSTVTLGRSTKRIVENFLLTVRGRLPKGRRICIASPKSVRIGKIGEELGFKHVESNFAYVHRSLTREIAIFEME